MTTLDQLKSELAGNERLTDDLRRVADKPETVAGLFPAAGRRYGREPLTGGWTTDEAARALLLSVSPADQVLQAYRYGDTAEKLAVLKALPLLPIGDSGVPLLEDALRTNDTRLVSAALGPYADRLGQEAWRQAVLKCVFMGVPLKEVHRLHDRADAELGAMLRAFAQERAAAGRDMPPDALALLDQLKEA
ncbi:EboA domain-containing protein [Paractinoplanes lichenicola]|uniref:EboA domain-containing protein n=1 Tax=Paractinoplanes lichenicola TaxID=2802976 RepID=A0ABS1VML3_9ACTN|nr:EboA domain-containing protein [Actinoplanes lichenicola]MBL7255450.1 EboA domain-containing protein [Actinoplanes lichenicola]